MKQPQFVLFGFPVRIEWFFFVAMWLIASGVGSSQRVAGVAVAAAVSLLVHELGHAFAFRRFGGRDISIRLLGFGGYTTCSGEARFKPQQSLVISAAGVSAEGLFVALPAFLALRLLDPGGDVEAILWYTLVLNLIWIVFNLLPILDLDGGHIAQHLARIVTGRDQTVPIRYLSIVVAVCIGVLTALVGQLLATAFMGFFAYRNVMALRDARRPQPPVARASAPTTGPNGPPFAPGTPPPTGPPTMPPSTPPAPPRQYPPIGRQD